MLAATRGHITPAQAIFAAVENERPEAPAAYVGYALACLFRGKAVDAVECLTRGLKRVTPDDRPDLQALLGLALQVSGRSSESRKLLATAGSHPLATALLEPVRLMQPGV